MNRKSREDGRIRLYYIQAPDKIGLVQKAYELLCGEGGLVVDDVREGESAVGELWQEIQRDLFGTESEIPYRFDFRSV